MGWSHGWKHPWVRAIFTKRASIGSVQGACALSKSLQVISINQAKANEDLLKIQVNLENLTKQALNLNYKIEWMDEDGIVINDSSAVWMPLYVRGAENVAVQSVASTPKAKNFWLKLQKAK